MFIVRVILHRVATCLTKQAQNEVEGVLSQLEMAAAAVEPLAFVGHPQACLFNRSVPLSD